MSCGGDDYQVRMNPKRTVDVEYKIVRQEVTQCADEGKCPGHCPDAEICHLKGKANN